MLGIERAVIDLLGQMWGVMLLNCVAALFSLTGLLGICAGDISIIILVSPALLICQQKNVWVYEFTGLDYWTGLLDWTTGLIKKCDFTPF